MTITHRFNPIAAHQPKFGVSFQTKYNPDLSAQDLQDALDLRRLQDAEAPRISAIPDQKDPFKINVSVQPGEISAEIKTENNGSFTVTRQGQAQPIAAFFNDILANLTQLAPSLKTQAERKQEIPQKADELILKVLKAIQQYPDIKDCPHGGGLVHRYLVQSGKGPNTEYTVNVARINMPHSPKFTVGIIDNTTTGKATRLDLKVTADDKIVLDFESDYLAKNHITVEQHGQEAVNKISQRLFELAEVLEKKKPIAQVSLAPVL